MIPSDKSAAVSRALSDAFGVTECDDIRAMPRGLGSALLFRIVVKGCPFLLRIRTRIDPSNDLARPFTCMQAAASAGLAPRVRYASVEDGISITDFVEALPFPAAEALVRMPGTLRALHALPPFPKTLNYATVGKSIRRLETANLLPQAEIEEAFHHYARLCAVYPRVDSDMVPCHNDLKPENVLFDGQRVWLADWTAAHVNDRYFDLAVVAAFLVTNEAEERALLEEYFGRAAGDYERARFRLMGQVVHMMAAAIFLLLFSGGRPVDRNEPLPRFGEFHRRIWTGEIDLADNALKLVYARVHWAQLLENARQERFEEALRIVSEREGSAKGTRRLLAADQ